MLIARIKRKVDTGIGTLVIVAVWMTAVAAFGQDTASQEATRAAAQTMPTHAQAAPQWEIAAGGKRTFDVASVRPSAPETSTKGSQVLTPFEGPPFKGGVFSANVPLLSYIVFAYKILDASQYQPLMAHLPKWAQTGRFTIEARVEGNPTKDQMRLLMQSLLEDRFNLRIRTESRQVPVYALILDKPGKTGPQLQPHPDNAPCMDRPADKPALSDDTEHPSYCGTEGWRVNGRLHTRMVAATMEQIATYVGGAAGFLGGMEPRPVLDQTGLSGKFDMNIEFTKDQGSQGAATDSESDSGPTFTNALKNQLGLKLVKQMAPVNLLIIDHVEQPSEN